MQCFTKSKRRVSSFSPDNSRRLRFQIRKVLFPRFEKTANNWPVVRQKLLERAFFVPDG